MSFNLTPLKNINKNLHTPLIIILAGFIIFILSLIIGTPSGSGDVNVEIIKTVNIMPAAHNVYSNSKALDGKYYLFKAKITNNTNKILEDVSVRYRVPGYIDWTNLDVIGEMYCGQSAVVLCYPKFKDDITNKTSQSKEKVEIEISWDGAGKNDIIEESFDFTISNRNEFFFTNIPSEDVSEWSDIYDNDILLTCFITPHDPIVQYYTQNIQEKILKGETASVTKDPNEAVRFLTGIYQATLQSGMVYSGTKGVPSSLQDINQFSQHNRLPREVITGNTGLCLELSLLYASVLSNAGLEPIIFLIPGHAYPGFKLNGSYYAIEATGIGGEGLGSILSPEQALNKGMKELEEFIQKAQNGDPRYSIVDINAANQLGATPMYLPDDQFLRNKVNEITAKWTTSAKPANPVIQSSRSTNTSSGSNLSMSIPGGWRVYWKPLYEIPILTAQVASPNQEIIASIFDTGYSNINQALNTVKNSLAMVGNNIQYQVNGNQLAGRTYSANGTFIWVGKAVNGPNGIRIVAIGSQDYLFEQYANIINQVFNTIQ